MNLVKDGLFYLFYSNKAPLDNIGLRLSTSNCVIQTFEFITSGVLLLLCGWLNCNSDYRL